MSMGKIDTSYYQDDRMAVGAGQKARDYRNEDMPRNSLAGSGAKEGSIMPEIQREMAYLFDAVESMAVSIDRLYEKMEPIMTPCSPECATKSPMEPVGTRHGAALAELVGRLRSLNSMVRDVVNRTEL